MCGMRSLSFGVCPSSSRFVMLRVLLQAAKESACLSLTTVPSWWRQIVAPIQEQQQYSTVSCYPCWTTPIFCCRSRSTGYCAARCCTTIVLCLKLIQDVVWWGTLSISVHPDLSADNLCFVGLASRFSTPPERTGTMASIKMMIRTM